MSKMIDEVLEDEDYEQFEDDVDEEVEEKATSDSKEEKPQNTLNDFKNICITECKRIIEKYIELEKEKKTDAMFLIGVDDDKKNIEQCVNYVMNQLVSTGVYGGDDSLMYPYIHDYYVDDIKEKDLKDNWSSRIRTVQAKVELSDEEKQEAIKKAKEQFIVEQKRKLAEAEKKRLEKEQLKALKKKAEEEAKKKEQEEAPLGGLFDL